MADYVGVADMERIVARGECAVGRFRGQTLLYIPIEIAERLGNETLTRLAAEVFSQEKLDRFGFTIFRTNSYCQLELPPVLNVPCQETADFDLPDTLAEKIVDEVK
jgi:hypothetical protein